MSSALKGRYWKSRAISTINDIDSWASLAPQRALAQRLLGDRADACLAHWWQQQWQRSTDQNFAESFSQHHSIAGVAPPDYLHRIVESRGLRLFGGIRFFGGDTAIPFVELFAWTAQNPQSIDWPRLLREVSAAWSEFQPLAVRVLLTADEPLPPDARTDMSVHAASYTTMSNLSPHPEIRVSASTDVDAAYQQIVSRYGEMATSMPLLASHIEHASRDELAISAAENRLFAIHAEGELAGFLATTDDHIAWLAGDVMLEIAVSSAFNGQGIAAAAQSALAQQMMAKTPDTLLIGTIDHLNTPSSRSASNAGRAVQMRYAFLPLC